MFKVIFYFYSLYFIHAQHKSIRIPARITTKNDVLSLITSSEGRKNILKSKKRF